MLIREKDREVTYACSQEKFIRYKIGHIILAGQSQRLGHFASPLYDLS